MFNVTVTRCNSFRCYLCQRFWPFEDDYEWCPCCREHCDGQRQNPTMTAAEANKLKLEFAFGWYLWDQNLL